MKYCLVLLLCFAVAGCAASDNAHKKTISQKIGDTTIVSGAENPLCGRWIIYKYVWGAAPSFVHKEDADAQLGRVMTILPDSFMFGDTVCNSPVYLRHVEDAIEWLYHYDYTNPDKLGIESKIIVVFDLACDSSLESPEDTADTSEPVFALPYEIIVINESQIVSVGNGAYFFLIKEKEF